MHNDANFQWKIATVFLAKVSFWLWIVSTSRSAIKINFLHLWNNSRNFNLCFCQLIESQSKLFFNSIFRSSTYNGLKQTDRVSCGGGESSVRQNKTMCTCEVVFVTCVFVWCLRLSHGNYLMWRKRRELRKDPLRQSFYDGCKIFTRRLINRNVGGVIDERKKALKLS